MVLISSILLWLILTLAPTLAFFLGVYLLFSLPLRRRERARLFLDVVEFTVKQGRPLEESIIALSKTRERTLGIHLQTMAAYLATGLRVSQALDAAPRLLPPRVAAMLKTGGQIGDIAKVIPACRQTLGDAISETRGAVNYLVVMAFLTTPFCVLIPIILFHLVLPKYREVFESLTPEISFPAGFQVIATLQPFVTLGLVLLMLLFLLGALLYVGGPRFAAWIQTRVPNAIDWPLLLLPWQRRRVHRDFSSVLALLLDADVPEADAIAMAADCTANGVFRRRVQRAVRQLQDGVSLAEAMATLDLRGEFKWRLSNATRGQGGFVRALSGWHEALDAKAYQQEQAVAHVFTTVLVLLNGAFVALVTITVFGSLVAIINGGLQW